MPPVLGHLARVWVVGAPVGHMPHLVFEKAHSGWGRHVGLLWRSRGNANIDCRDFRLEACELGFMLVGLVLRLFKPALELDSDLLHLLQLLQDGSNASGFAGSPTFELRAAFALACQLAD